MQCFSRLNPLVYLSFVLAILLSTVIPLAAATSITYMGFERFPLSPGSNAGPKVILDEVSGTDITLDMYVYKKVNYWPDSEQYHKTFNPLADPSGGSWGRTGRWTPNTDGMYRLRAVVHDGEGNEILDQYGEYFNVSASDYDWITHLMDTFIQSQDLAGDQDGDGKRNTSEDIQLFMENAYQNNKKYLFYFSFDISSGIPGISDQFPWVPAAAIGGLFTIDLSDYYGISVEGRDGYVSTWFEGRDFFGYTAFPTAYGIGVIPVICEVGSEDAREDMQLWTFGANAQLLGSHAKLETNGFVNSIDLALNEATLAKDFSIGTTAKGVVSLEIQRRQLNYMLANSIFSIKTGSTAAASLYAGWKTGELTIVDAGLSISFASSLLKMINLFNDWDTIKQSRGLTISDNGSGRTTTFIPNSLKISKTQLTLSYGQSANLNLFVNGGTVANPAGVSLKLPDFDYTVDPEGALSYSNGMIRWETDDTEIQEATITFNYAGKIAQTRVLREGYTPPEPEVTLAIDNSNVPDYPIAKTQENVGVHVTADGADADDASVSWEITSDGIIVDSGRMAHTGGGNYEADIIWPWSEGGYGLCNFVIRAVQGAAEKNASSVIQFWPPNPDYGPTLVRKYPSREVEINGGTPIDFKVLAKTTYDSLDRVEWKFDGMPVPDQTTYFNSNEGSEGVAVFSITPAKDIEDYRTSVYAKVYRKDGENESLFWALNVLSNEKPVLTKVLPNTDEELVVPLGIDGRTTFTARVSDLDDDVHNLQWFVNGEFYEEDTVGGGDPASDESTSIIFSEVDDYVVEAYVQDDRGNSASLIWYVHAGIMLEGNTPPEGVIEPPDGLTWDAKFRVGYRYPFEYHCTDVDGNLAFAAVYLDDNQDWCPWITDTSDPLFPYQDLKLNGYSDKPNIYAMVFTEPGDHIIKLLVRDGNGAESVETRSITVYSADEGSSTAPEFIIIYPDSVTDFTIASGTDWKFAFTAKDKDADIELLRVYVDDYLYHQTRSNVGGDTAFEYEGSVDGLSNGSHSIFFELLDQAGNTARSKTYTVNVGTAGYQAPVIDEETPSYERILYVDASTSRLYIRLKMADADGDLKYVYQFNTAGPLSDVDGNENGQDYDRHSIDAYGTNYFDDNFLFNIENDGILRLKLIDASGNYRSMSWDVRKVPSVGTTNDPVIQWATVAEGEHFNVKYEGEDLTFWGEIYDIDGDLDRIEAWKGDVLADTFIFHEYAGNACVRFEKDDLNIEADLNDREGESLITFKVYDKAGNITERHAYFSMGPWNHLPDYPSAPLNVVTNEDADVLVLPQIVDEDGDIVTATVKTAPMNGTVSGPSNALRYMPFENFNGEDTLVLSCDDGYGGAGEISVKIAVKEINDSPVVVDENNNETDNIRVQVSPNQSYSLEELVSSLQLVDADGSISIGEAEVTVLSESENINRSDDNIPAAEIQVALNPILTDSSEFSNRADMIINPNVSGEPQFISVAFKDENGRPSAPLTIIFIPPVDTDHDGIPDDIENSSCTDPNDDDTDDDGIIDGVEDKNQNGIVDNDETNPCDPDSDDDGIQDGTESGKTAADVGLDTDLAVFLPDLDPSTTTNPLLADTDGDGVLDGDEDLNKNGRVDPGEGDPNLKEVTSMPWIPLLLLND